MTTTGANSFVRSSDPGSEDLDKNKKEENKVQNNYLGEEEDMPDFTRA